MKIKGKAKTRKTEAIRPTINEHAAGVDVGAREIYSAINPEHDDQPVRCYATFTGELKKRVAWFLERGVTTVAMEATGVYWIPLAELLEEAGIEVCLVNPRHVKNVPGRKTDVQDCQWLQYLHSVGLLRAAFRLAAQGLHHANNEMGEYYRRMRAKLGGAAGLVGRGAQTRADNLRGDDNAKNL